MVVQITLFSLDTVDDLPRNLMAYGVSLPSRDMDQRKTLALDRTNKTDHNSPRLRLVPVEFHSNVLGNAKRTCACYEFFLFSGKASPILGNHSLDIWPCVV